MKDHEAILQKLHNLHEKRPLIHRVETERQSGSAGPQKFYGVTKDLVQYIVSTVNAGMSTAETGCGISTLAFSAMGASHTAVTPDAGEEKVVRKEAEISEISLAKTRFAIGFSENVLPGLELKDLSVALIDGKHAFPWPIIDWFYFARAIKKDGILIVDDAPMPSVKMLCDILENSPSEWKKIESLDNGQSLVYRCLKENALDVIWNEQLMNQGFNKPSFRARAIGKLKSLVKP